MSYLNGRNYEVIVVPIKCCTEQGTAFFIEKNRLLTARHVVRAYFDSSSAPEPIILKIAGKEVLCKADEVILDGNKIDVAVLTVVENDVYEAEDPIELLADSFVKDLALRIYGYPKQVAMGEALVTLDVRNRLRISNWNDRSLIRDDNLQLSFYDGLSGAPVINKEGRAVGIVTMQNCQTLNYLSVDKIRNSLMDKKISFSTDWEKEDDTLCGQGRSYHFCEEATETVGDRYMPDVHQPNTELEYFLDTCLDLKKSEESAKLADDLADFVGGLPKVKKDIIRKDLKIQKEIDFQELARDGYYLLDRCCEYFNSSRFRQMLNLSDGIKLHQLCYELDQIGLNWAKRREVKNICLIGKAGSGKTHTLCHYSLHKQDIANIYLFFGTEFKPHESVIGHITDRICMGESIEDFNKKMIEKRRYAVVIIDAINEGLGCSFWNSNIGGLRSGLSKYSNIKLIVSIRSPFDKDVNDLTDDKNWNIYHIKGFVDLDKAIDDYIDYYEVDKHVKERKIEGFKNPLFLKLFCETYHSLSFEDRNNISKRNLYKKYVEKKNGIISETVDEDPDINVTDKYLLKLANHSVFYSHCNPVSRLRARQIAKGICPGRFWKNDLLHACLSSNILLEDLSDDGGQSVMFEYENLGDYYKAERLLSSKMTTSRLMMWMEAEISFLKSHKDVPNQKFETAVKALFDCWWYENEDVSGFRQVQSDGPLYDLYVDYLNESDIPYNTYIDALLKLDKDKVNPLRLAIENVDVSIDEAYKIHKKLLAYRNVGTRDVIWTRYVNQMYELYGDEYISEIPVDLNPEHEISENDKKYLLCITWMMTSSHPRCRSVLIRKLRIILCVHPEVITWLLDLFENVNDPYVLIGLYCAIYGALITIHDKKWSVLTAVRIYERYYEHVQDVPQDLILRQWTLKIIEWAYHIDSNCDYWTRIKTPFTETQIDKTAICDYANIKKNRSFFGLQHGSMMMFSSIFEFEDFNRYIIGTNNHSRSCDYFIPTGEPGKFIGVPLTEIMAELSYYIVNEFGWNDKLGNLDNGKYSRNRSHNDKERIGKKYQWLAWYRINARLMDACRVSKEQYFYEEKAEENDLSVNPMPWNSSIVSRFDPTLDPESAYDSKAGLIGVDNLPIDGEDEDGWINMNEYLPTFRYNANDENGSEYVLLMGYDTTEGKDGKETFLFSNAGFVHEEDAVKFAEWSKCQNFYGRWMPESRGMIEFLWNEYPWSDAYIVSHESYTVWEQPRDCPIKMMLSYEAQLQEDWEGIDESKEYLTTVYMPCREMMVQLGMSCSEIRGVIKTSDDNVAAINTGNGDFIKGLFVRKDLLDSYLNRNNYVLFYYVLGEKLQKLGGTSSIMKDLSAAYQYNPDGELIHLQPIRVIEREKAKPIENVPDRIEELNKKNITDGLTTRETLELMELINGNEDEDKGHSTSQG